MSKKISRRDFVKATAFLVTGMSLPSKQAHSKVNEEDLSPPVEDETVDAMADTVGEAEGIMWHPYHIDGRYGRTR